MTQVWTLSGGNFRSCSSASPVRIISAIGGHLQQLLPWPCQGKLRGADPAPCPFVFFCHAFGQGGSLRRRVKQLLSNVVQLIISRLWEPVRSGEKQAHLRITAGEKTAHRALAHAVFQERPSAVLHGLEVFKNGVHFRADLRPFNSRHCLPPPISPPGPQWWPPLPPVPWPGGSGQNGPAGAWPPGGGLRPAAYMGSCCRS